ncbi:vesicle transport v-snare protein vti1 [Dichomitus squalens LYAD-421 SS1]|uniref:Vesicle transport v-snare protein vti1 n=1 Tax=Dichomitus squalens (strain LYAD-421) TaxID=732165 RepID=R7SZH6_DICSQ|nr:vesicle transport v-snare protein vti1 [Dichomitus squalens LYAD-421 SS1]EJF61486.1 vesicle transport v-snare protein vti1 [Dichomitus squalens LYAD-421 SS1]
MDNSPTALLNSYESDFKQIIHSIRDKLEGDAKDAGQSEQRKAALRRVELELDEADEMSLRPSYQSRIKASKADLTRYKKLSKDLHAQLSRAGLLARPDLPGTPTSDEPYGATSDRTRLLAGTELLEDGSRRLLESQRIALGTEEQGADILRSLRGPSQQIQNARAIRCIPLSSSVLQRADTSIDRASGTLKMIRRMYQQRVVTAAIIVVIVLLILVILFSKLVC